jgi:hypothetical protein
MKVNAFTTPMYDESVMPWAEPVDFLRELIAPSFTAADVPAQIGGYALAYAKQTGFDPSLCVLPAVAAAAAALSDDYQIVADVGTDWQQSARLWVLGIGPSGAGKSPIRKAVLHALHALHAEETQHYDAEVSTLKSGDAKPPRPRVVIADATIEALSEVLRENPRGVLVAVDEFESFMGSLDQYRRSAASRDRGEWLRLFDGGPHTVERVERGSVFVPNFGASLLSSTTPTVLKKLGKLLPEDGLLQRFLVAVGHRQMDGESVPNMAQLGDQFGETLRRLYGVSPYSRDGRVYMDDAAQTAFNAWTRSQRIVQAAFDDRDASLGAHLAKYPTFALRLALTFHAAANANNLIIADRDPARFRISSETMHAAFRFLDRCRQHALVLYLSLRGDSPAFELARAIARSVLALARPVIERRDLIRHLVAFRKAEDGEQYRALELLQDLAWLRPAVGYRKGHHTRYTVNPLLSERFACIAAREREHRAAVREQILAASDGRRI